MKQFIYWLPDNTFKTLKSALSGEGIELVGARKTPCETLKANGQTAVYASPQIFNKICARQGSWYRSSERRGEYLLLSPIKLPENYDDYLDAAISESNFMPETLPDAEALRKIVDSSEYQDQKPRGWEKRRRVADLMVKILFSIKRFWGWRESVNSHWLNHRANHANFLSNEVTTELDGEQVPYSVTENAGVCSSCVEFFNIVKPNQRKLVRSCPGAIIFGDAKKDVYMDVIPLNRSEKLSESKESARTAGLTQVGGGAGVDVTR